MPKKATKLTPFEECMAGIRGCQPGQERNMYPYIRDLFVRVLGFPAGDVLTDVQDMQGSIPDVAVLASTGIKDDRDRLVKSRWLVLEAKDEPGVFLSGRSRQRIFADKAKYIDLDTVWFAMVDPTCLVLRRVTTRAAQYDPGRDTIVLWDGLTEAQFRQDCIEITAEHAGVNRRLQEFRDGAAEHIAQIKLSSRDEALSDAAKRRLETARGDFYMALRASVRLLHQACRRAVRGSLAEAYGIRQQLRDFDARYGGSDFAFDPFHLQGKQIASSDAWVEHQAEIRAIHERIRRQPRLARLGIYTWPDYLARTKQSEERAADLLAAETASLMLARSIMLRFFEDHGFFGDRRYLCNGGIKAFQAMRHYFGSHYSKLLSEAYGKGSEIYATIFCEHDLDWVFGVAEEQLSVAIELSLFYLSHFDFASVDEDVLSNIYGEFLDSGQRKRLGEHYTPPDIARFIVRELGIRAGDTVIDPACGLGTFLIEAYKAEAGRAIGQGAGTYDDAVQALRRVRGNDLNPFSAMIAQIQLLWHLFPLRDEIVVHGFPEARVTAGHNSLRQQTLESAYTDFSAIDSREYAAVIGNPPYVRPERQEAELAAADREFFDRDISSQGDLYALFLYKAMTDWCRDATATEPPGKLGFVIPLSFCDTRSAESLRRLFGPEGRWRILEIVDLELIGPDVFGSDVVPMILLAEKRAPLPDDTIRLRVADERCVRQLASEGGRIVFDLDAIPPVEMPYADVFSADGRILTKLTPERKRLCDKFAGKTFDDIVRRFWVGKRGSRIEAWANRQPEESADLRWEEADMLRMGAAFRRSIHHLETGGLPVYKGENIVACRLEGSPVETKIDISRMDDPALWRFADLLPAQGFAFHCISTALTAAPFCPAELALLNTASLFFPQESLQDFPFDMLVLSRLYQYHFALTQREAILFRARCHVYPSTARRLPWHDGLAAFADDLKTLREWFLEACRNLHQREEVLRTRLQEGATDTLFQMASADETLVIEWSDTFANGSPPTIGGPLLLDRGAQTVVQLCYDDLLSWVAFSDPGVAECFLEGILLYEGEALPRKKLSQLPLPAPARLNEWRETVKAFDEQSHGKSIDAVLDEVDAIVAKVYGFTPEEVAFIGEEFQADPMLRRVTPNLPFTKRRLVGLRRRLAAADRYQQAYRTRS